MNNMSESDYTVVPCEPNFRVHNFTGTVFEKNIRFEILKMDSSYFFWIGLSSQMNMGDLSLALNTRFQKMPLSAQLFGSAYDLCSPRLASKLSKKLGKMALVSYNLNEDCMADVEKLLWNEINTNTEFFCKE